MSRETRDILEQWFYITSVLVVLAGGSLWLTNLNARAQENSEQIKEIKNRVDQTAAQFEEIRTRLTRIEDKMGHR